MSVQVGFFGGLRDAPNRLATIAFNTRDVAANDGPIARPSAHSPPRRATASVLSALVVAMSAALSASALSSSRVLAGSRRVRSSGVRAAPVRRPAVLPAPPRRPRRSPTSSSSAARARRARGASCEALARGAKVTVLARTPSKLALAPAGRAGRFHATSGPGRAPIADPNLTVVQGSVTDPAAVARCFTKDTTGVVVSLGGKTKDVGKTMLTDGTRNVIDAMKAAGVARVAVVTSIGAGDSADQAPLVFKVLMATVMAAATERDDKNNQEQLFLGPAGPGRDLEFCIVRPGGLDGPAHAASSTSSTARRRPSPRARTSRFQPRRPLRGGLPVRDEGVRASRGTGGTSWVKDRKGKGMMEA